MPAVLLAPRAPDLAGSTNSWHRRWSEQQPLLERQHDRLEGLLDRLVEDHCRLEQDLGPSSLADEQAGSAKLIRLLVLHLRLEERWLSQWGCFSAGHRSSHRQVVDEAADTFSRVGHLHTARLQWLMDVQSWFGHHRHGVDALAYARATHITSQP